MDFAKKFQKTFHLTIWEAAIAITAVVVFFILEKIVYHDAEHAPIFLIVYGFIVGTWLAFRPSEWAVTGLNSGAKHVGMSEYVAGILSSLASNLPEAVIAMLLLMQGLQLVAVVTVLSAAGFNALILGIAILIATAKKKGHIAVPEDLEKKEAPIIRWAIVALSMTVVFGFIEYFQVDNIQDAVLTKPVAGLLAASYLFYLVYIILVKDTNKKMSLKNHEDQEVTEGAKNINKEESEEKHEDHKKLPVYLTIILLVLGFVGIYFGGETLTWGVTELMEGGGSGIGEIGLALILGAAGAVPEHGIAVISAAKDEVEVGIGNAMGGVLQSALLIFGILGIVVSITLHPFVLLQIAAIAGSLWFVKRCIHDKRFDIFEAIMIILLQVLVFVILFQDIAFFT